MPIRVAIDAMGGDHAPTAAVEGSALALAESDDLAVLLVGQADRLNAEIDRLGLASEALRVVDAADVIGMDESPAAAVKKKRQSSIHIGLGAHKAGHADAFVSAGNTGAVMAASLFILGRVSGVSRPSVVTLFPTTQGRCVVLDAGTNVDCRPEHLVQFAKMGSVYAERVFSAGQASIGLLNIGEEPGKGNELAKETYDLLQAEADLNFKGNIEGRDVFNHGADVVVCDGFVGNVMLKFGESMAGFLKHLFGAEMKRLHYTPEQMQLVGQVMKGVSRNFDYEETGGAPLLGVNGNVLIGHGSSSVRAFRKLVLAGAEVARRDVAGSIAAVFNG
ncbi:MAG: phosphate acyltransferase PlsX [Rhodothermales bacterium]